MFWKNPKKENGDVEFEMEGNGGRWRIVKNGKWSKWHSERTFSEAREAALREQHRSKK